MKVEKGSVLQSILTNQQIEKAAWKLNFGGDTTVISTFGDIKVTTKPNCRATVQFGEKAKPIEVSI